MSAQSSTEPNLSDAIRLIGASGLENSKISHWCCSIRAVAAALGLPPENVPARWQAIAHRVKQLHHARVAMSEKTLKNHIANRRPPCAIYPAIKPFLREERPSRRNGRSCGNSSTMR